MIRRVAWVALLWFLPAPALAQGQNDILAEFRAGPPATEIPRWNTVAKRLYATAPELTAETLPGVLGTILGVGRLEGVDPRGPLAGWLLNPKRFPKPVVLLVPVKDAVQLKASARGLAVRIEKSNALIGEQASVDAMAARAFATQDLPQKGIFATGFLASVWSAYSMEITAIGAVMAAGAANQTGTTPAAPAGLDATSAKLLGSSFGWITALFEQGEWLRLELRPENGLEALLTVKPKPSTTLATFIAAQKPSMFAGAEKLPADSGRMLMLGAVDFSTVQTALVDWMVSLGKIKDPSARPALEELFRLSTGEMIFSMKPGSPAESYYAALLGVKDSARVMALQSKLLQVMNGAAIDGAKVATKPLPKTTYNGLAVQRSTTQVDYSKASPELKKAAKGKTRFKIENAWTALDSYVAYVGAPAAVPELKRVVDLMQGKASPTPLSLSHATSLEQARAEKESFVLLMNMQDIPTQANGPKLTGALNMGLGFADGQLRLRFQLAQ